MSRKVGLLVWIILMLLCFAFLIVSSGYGFERKQPLPIPPHSAFRPPFSPEGEPGFCIIQYDSDSLAWYWEKFDAGDGIAVFMDPGDCVFDNIYPFKISNVYFYLYDPGVFDWPVEIEVSALNVDVDTLIDTLSQPPDTVIVTPFPGAPDYSQTFSIEEDSAYDTLTHPNPINLTLDEVWCITSPFFLQITYTGGTAEHNPSLGMSHEDDLPDTNHNWLLWEGDYYEWDTAWVDHPHPGRAIMRVIGYPYAIDCHQLCWWWLPGTAVAPNGMPDFDQYQFGSDSVAMCGPAAAANCLVWLDAIQSMPDPDSLIRLLSDYFNTDPDSGSLVDSITAGLNTLFEEYRLNLYSAKLQEPAFSEIVDSLNNPTNIILLLGFWQNIDDSLYRIGGHFVSAAGACQGSLWTALSDPAADNAEEGGRGRFLPPHEPYPHDSTLHNTPGFVSHDAYVSNTISAGPFAVAWRLQDHDGGSLPWLPEFEGKNFQPGQDEFQHTYDPAESLYTVVEYAIMILEKPPRDWDWMPPTAQAPNGMPDFDQRQFGDTSAFCGPTAAANCLVWLDVISSIQNPDSLIRLLSDYFHTDPDSGTLVDSITAGLDSLFAEHSLSLYSSRFENPVYSDIYDSLGIDDTLRKPAVLLVGLWQNIDDSLFRIGGHYVSVAGAYEDSSWTGLSDPGADNAETGAKGRFLPSHNPHPDDHTLHNTPGYVSHDAYVSEALSLVPYAETVWRLTGYEDDSLPWFSQFEGQNFQPEQEQYRHDLDSTETLYAVVEYAIMFVEKPTLVEGEEGEVPRYFELRQSYPNPFNNQAVIKYSLFKRTEVSLVIYNVLGQKVRTLVNNERQRGNISVIWDGKDDRGRDLSSGIYFYQLRAGQLTETRRMVLLK